LSIFQTKYFYPSQQSASITFQQDTALFVENFSKVKKCSSQSKFSMQYFFLSLINTPHVNNSVTTNEAEFLVKAVENASCGLTEDIWFGKWKKNNNLNY
jgi:hypothetical protein